MSFNDKSILGVGRRLLSPKCICLRLKSPTVPISKKNNEVLFNYQNIKFQIDVSAGGRYSQTCLIVMLKPCTCSLVRPPKVSPPPLRVIDLFILIYSFISLQISMFHCHSFAVFTALMILGMYGGALLKAKRYSALKSMSFEKKN